MVRAYVLFGVELGAEEQVLKEVKLVDEVQEAYVTYGVFDLVLKVNADSSEGLKQLVTHRLRTIANVRSTMTLMLTEE